MIEIIAVKDWFKDHDSLMFQLQLTNIRLMANSVALLNMFIPMASPERATNLVEAIVSYTKLCLQNRCLTFAMHLEIVSEDEYGHHIFRRHEIVT